MSAYVIHCSWARVAHKTQNTRKTNIDTHTHTQTDTAPHSFNLSFHLHPKHALTSFLDCRMRACSMRLTRIYMVAHTDYLITNIVVLYQPESMYNNIPAIWLARERISGTYHRVHINVHHTYYTSTFWPDSIRSRTRCAVFRFDGRSNYDHTVFRWKKGTSPERRIASIKSAWERAHPSLSLM